MEKVQDEGREGDYLNQIILDIKALVLLKRSDEQLRSMIEEKLVNSHDEDIRIFVGALNRGPRAKGSVMSAVSEMALSAFLLVSGLLVLAPLLVGASAPAVFSSYLVQVADLASKHVSLFPAVAAILFLFSLIMIVGSAMLLRRAAHELKESGYTVASE
jgi:hypothetical protein